MHAELRAFFRLGVLAVVDAWLGETLGPHKSLAAFGDEAGLEHAKNY